jgi:branched-chain amino acid transport system permease protein
LQTALFLAVDGLANGAVYALLGLGIVIIYLVTRVINIAHGDFAMLSAMTMVSLEQQQVPPTSLLLAAGCIAWGLASAVAARRGGVAAIGRPLLVAAACAAAAYALPWIALAAGTPPALSGAVAILLVACLGPVFHRLAIEPIPRASVLVYIIVTLGAHLIVQGMTLHLWGPQALSVAPMLSGALHLGGVSISHQALLVLLATALAMAGLYTAFRYTLAGKALQASAVNRTGAVLCGIGVEHAGRLAFFFGAALAGLAGVLLAPLVGVHYEMGFLVGLKGFVGATMGGLVSYPGAVLGALIIGALESWFSYLSSAFRDALVFALIVPLLLLQSWYLKRRGGTLDH